MRSVDPIARTPSEMQEDAADEKAQEEALEAVAEPVSEPPLTAARSALAPVNLLVVDDRALELSMVKPRAVYSRFRR
jgi:hypothetical protein